MAGRIELHAKDITYRYLKDGSLSQRMPFFTNKRRRRPRYAHGRIKRGKGVIGEVRLEKEIESEKFKPVAIMENDAAMAMKIGKARKEIHNVNQQFSF